MRVFLSTDDETFVRKFLVLDGRDLLVIDPKNADVIICTDLVEGLVRNNEFPQTLIIVVTCVDKDTPIPQKMSVVGSLEQFLKAN